jgi:hypothetical protein
MTRGRPVKVRGRPVIPAKFPFRYKTDEAATSSSLHIQEAQMKLYAIRRRSAFADVPDLEKAAARSAKVGNVDMPDQVRWIRSYVVEEPDGRIGTVCIYQATDVAAIREHARRAEIAADEIVPVLNTVVVRQDPA